MLTLKISIFSYIMLEYSKISKMIKIKLSKVHQPAISHCSGLDLNFYGSSINHQTFIGNIASVLSFEPFDSHKAADLKVSFIVRMI